MSASRVHLIRHGEVDNPHHVVYADLPGYGLSARGLAEAAAAAEHLAAAPVAAVLSSPLLRARQTAGAIAGRHGLDLGFDERLTEWAGGLRWAGVRWEDLEAVFPGELTAYLETPLELGFGSESLLACGARVAAVVKEAATALPEGDLVVVSHQDPIHSGHLDLVGHHPDDYHKDKPAHAGIVTLDPTVEPWRDVGYWEPEQGEAFPPLP